MSNEKTLNELKKATMASFLSKTSAMREGMDPDTWNGKNPKNPLVTLHATKEKKIDGREPMIGHMHLSTAADIHGLDHAQALSDIRVHGQHVGGDKSVRVTLSQHQKVWEETLDEAGKNPYGPGYKLVDKDEIRKSKNRAKGVETALAKLAKEETVNELKTSTLASVATKRYQQAQAALKDKDYGGCVKNKQKSMKAADATTPKSGWSPEDDKKNEEVVPVISATEKYRQIKEAKLRARKGK